MSLFDRLVTSVIPLVPRPIVGRFAGRYIAGSTLDEAVTSIRNLNAQGFLATVDVLGEHVTHVDETHQAADAYLTLLDRLRSEALDSNISVKLTQMGLAVDRPTCFSHMRAICAKAQSHDCFVRIDMEDSSVTQVTLDLYQELRQEFPDVGVVIQSCLRRSRADVKQLASQRANVRLCKGIYVEPRAVAYRDADIIRRSYVELLATLLEGGSYVGIATHDEILVYEALRLIDDLGLGPERYEFQMLLGVEEELRRILVDQGHRLRVYVPYGRQWYAYSIRRLKENPRIAGHIARRVLHLP